MSCLLIGRVKGCKRVPLPPARIMPFRVGSILNLVERQKRVSAERYRHGLPVGAHHGRVWHLGAHRRVADGYTLAPLLQSCGADPVPASRRPHYCSTPLDLLEVPPQPCRGCIEQLGSLLVPPCAQQSVTLRDQTASLCLLECTPLPFERTTSKAVRLRLRFHR